MRSSLGIFNLIAGIVAWDDTHSVLWTLIDALLGGFYLGYHFLELPGVIMITISFVFILILDAVTESL